MKPDATDNSASVFPGGLRVFLIRAVAGAGAVHLAGMLFTFLVGVQLARGLGIQGYGQYGIAMAVIALASIPGEFGLPRLVMRESAAASSKGELPHLYGAIRWADRAALTLSLMSAALLILGGWLFRDDDSAVARAITIGAPIVPLVALLKIRGGTLQGLNYVVRGLIPNELLRPLIFSALLFLLFTVVPQAGAVEAVGLNVVTAIIGLAFAFVWLRTRLPKPKPVSLIQNGRQWLTSSFRIALADGLRISYFQLATLLLGVLGSVAAVGLFRIAISIAVVIAVPAALINTVAAPIIARLWAEGDVPRLQQLCTHSARWMTLGVAAFSLPFVLWGGPLIGQIFGQDFAAADTALVIVASSHFISAIFGPNVALLTMAGHEGRVTRAMFAGLLIGILLALLLIPRWAETGAAIAAFGSIAFWNIATWLDARRLLRIETSILTAKHSRLSP